MLKVTDLTKSYGTHTLFDEASFVVNAKERIGLIGRNGHGKTTLLRILLGREHADSGEIYFPKHYRLGYLEQVINFTQKTLVDEGCLGLPEHSRDERWKVEKVLSGLGFTDEDFTKDPTTFSGGFQIRLQLAKTLVSDAHMLLLDEPTNYLDIVSIRWLITFLRSWPNELILITHDRGFMDKVVTHILGIHRQNVRKIEGTTEKYYSQIEIEEEVHERTRQKDEKKRKKTEIFINKFRAKARQGSLVQSRIKMLDKQEKIEKLGAIQSLDFVFPSRPFPAKTMLHTHNVVFSYTGNKPYLVEHLSLAIHKHDRVCIIGKNGKGKSTLLKLLACELEPMHGNVKLHPSLEVGYFGQTNIARLHDHKTVYEELLESDASCTPQKARNIAGVMLFTDDQALKKISVLSGGEKSRVLLGKLLASPSHLLLLDEPTSHLDMESCEALTAAIQEFDGSVVMVTHDEEIIRAVATKLVVFKHDKVFVYEGTYDEFLEDIGWETDTMPTEQKIEKPLSKKELRQKRVEFLQPIKKKMSTIEHAIQKLEEETDEIAKALIDAATAGGESSKFAELGKRNREILESLEHYYRDLDKVIKEHEKMEKELEGDEE